MLLHSLFQFLLFDIIAKISRTVHKITNEFMNIEKKKRDFLISSSNFNF